eukprot:5982170-Amphidinium_carterae.1
MKSEPNEEMAAEECVGVAHGERQSQLRRWQSCHPAAQSLFGTHIRDGSAGCMAPRLETTARKGAGRDCPALPATRQN